MLRWGIDVPKNEVVFTHRNLDTGSVKNWAVDRMVAVTQEHYHNERRKHSHLFEMFRIMTEEKAYNMIKEQNNPELHRVMRLLNLDDKTWMQLPPIFFAKDDEGFDVLVDGTHRYIAAFETERPIIAVKMKEFYSNQFLISGLPDFTEHHLKTIQSGIL